MGEKICKSVHIRQSHDETPRVLFLTHSVYYYNYTLCPKNI